MDISIKTDNLEIKISGCDYAEAVKMLERINRTPQVLLSLGIPFSISDIQAGTQDECHTP
jgi:hypothetical protein